MTITIVTVGAKNTPDFQHIIDDYMKRLPRSVTVEWKLIKPFESSERQTTITKESERILSAMPTNSYVILLDERGEHYTNERLSQQLFSEHKSMCIIIGGAYGVGQSVHSRADVVLSLSKLVFPHRLVRVMLAEQIYRSYTISINHPYHHS